jgi:hypothetical protein
MFFNGPVARAVNTVKERGVAYFSAAGNQARNSYQAKFLASGELGLGGGPLHNFAGRRSVDSMQAATVQALTFTTALNRESIPERGIAGY